jgi:hypothetical protein
VVTVDEQGCAKQFALTVAEHGRLQAVPAAVSAAVQGGLYV